MAIYHFSMKTISRSAGRTATAAAAYRAGANITDRNTGEVHDYTLKKGVLKTDIVLPAGAPRWAFDREQLWNAAEEAEKRKNSTVAREIVVALPAELDEETRSRMVRGFAEKLTIRHKCAVDYAIHEPNSKGDDRNHHAHLLMSTRRLEAEGFAEKTRELDDRKSGEVDYWRKEWAEHVNRYLAQEGLTERISHLSLAEQGIEREPTKHKGVAATAIERKNRAAILENPKLNAIEKSRRLRQAEPLRIAEPSEPTGQNFGQKLSEIPEVREALYEAAAFAGEIRQEEMNIHALMSERSELVRQIKAEESSIQAMGKIGRLIPTLSPFQQKGLAVMVKAFAQARDGNSHLPHTDRLKQFTDSLNHVADEAAAGRNLAHLEALGKMTDKQARPQQEQDRERGDDYEMDR